MGCDGGTIPTRDELVKTAKRPEQVNQAKKIFFNPEFILNFLLLQKDKDSVRLYKWRHCALTQEPLDKPVVACELGRLYNKEAIIEKLLNAKSEGKSESNTADHIKSLKDVKELQLEPNPAFKDKVTVGDGGYIDSQRSPWICPLTSQEMNGRFPFVFDWSNGKVMSQRAHKMLKEDKVSAIAEENLIILNPEDNGELMFTKMEARRARIKAAKKAEKEKRKAEKSVTNDDNGEQPTKKVKIVEAKASSSSKKSANESLIKNGHNKGVQNDPSKSEVYKSLFSSHHTALNKPKGNWVTFDPRYN